MMAALVWDVDGTLAETERDGHRLAFNAAFAAHGLSWRWDVARYGELLAVTGGFERLLHDMADRVDAPPSAAERQALARALHARKNEHYAALVSAGGIALRPGVQALIIDALNRGVRLAIATTTSRANVDALLRQHFGATWTRLFTAVVCGEDVAKKKPDPEVYNRALAVLGLLPDRCLAIEDSPAGVAAACAAGVSVIVTRSEYFPCEGIDGALAIGPGLALREAWVPALQRPGPGRVSLDDILDWYARQGTALRRRA